MSECHHYKTLSSTSRELLRMSERHRIVENIRAVFLDISSAYGKMNKQEWGV